MGTDILDYDEIIMCFEELALVLSELKVIKEDEIKRDELCRLVMELVSFFTCISEVEEDDEVMDNIWSEKEEKIFCIINEFPSKLEDIQVEERAEDFGELCQRVKWLMATIASDGDALDEFEANSYYTAEYCNTEISIKKNSCDVGSKAILWYPGRFLQSGLSLTIMYIVHVDTDCHLPEELEDLECPTAYDISLRFTTEKDVMYVYFQASNMDFLNDIRSRDEEDFTTDKMVVFEVTEDVMRPSFYGYDAYEYCCENDLFFKAFSKGELVYTTLDSLLRACNLSQYSSLPNTFFVNEFEDIVKEVWRKGEFETYSRAQLADIFRSRLEDGLSLRHCKTRQRLSFDSSLFDVWLEATHWLSSAPSESLEYKGLIDGNVLFREFAELDS